MKYIHTHIYLFYKALSINKMRSLVVYAALTAANIAAKYITRAGYVMSHPYLHCCMNHVLEKAFYCLYFTSFF